MLCRTSSSFVRQFLQVVAKVDLLWGWITEQLNPKPYAQNNIFDCWTSKESSHNKSQDLCSVWMLALLKTSDIYLDQIGQLRGHQVVKLFFAQGAGRSVFPSERLKLGHKGADGSLHDAENKTEADRTISTQAIKSKIDVPTRRLISPDECCVEQTENTSQHSDHHTFTYIYASSWLSDAQISGKNT